MGIILNDAKAKYKTDKSLEQTLIDNAPFSDSVFDEICEAYEVDDLEGMNVMISCKVGTFDRLYIEGYWKWVFKED